MLSVITSANICSEELNLALVSSGFGFVLTSHSNETSTNSAFPLLPQPLFTARHFCFHMVDFSGNTLIFVAFGVGSRVCCACKVLFLFFFFFKALLTPVPKLNCALISRHAHSTISPYQRCQ